MAETFEDLSDTEWPPMLAKRDFGVPHTPFRKVVHTLWCGLIVGCRWCAVLYGP
jgi:hypothetical protein